MPLILHYTLCKKCAQPSNWRTDIVRRAQHYNYSRIIYVSALRRRSYLYRRERTDRSLVGQRRKTITEQSGCNFIIQQIMSYTALKILKHAGYNRGNLEFFSNVRIYRLILLLVLSTISMYFHRKNKKKVMT